MTMAKTRLSLPFGDTYANAVGVLPGANESWIDGLRNTSRSILRSQGLPTRKNEAWKYTALGELAATPFIPASRAEDVDVTQVPVTVPFVEGALKLVFVNGVFRADLSDPLNQLSDEAVVRPLSEALSFIPQDLKKILGSVSETGSSIVAALNTGFIEDGLLLRVKAGTELKEPIHVVSIGASGVAPGSFHPRFEVELEASSQATFIESHVGLPGQPYLANAVTEVVVGEGAKLGHYTIINDDTDAYHLGQTAVFIDRAGKYESFILSMGGKLVRREVKINLEEDHGEARVDGVYGIADKQHSEIVSEMLHKAPHTLSSQVVKGALSGESRGVFQGRVHVAREAQKTDGRQLHKALLLNKGPEVDCKPELEIFADDVQCAHGATTGELDKEQIFYLASRGIDEGTARALLIEGFLNEVVLNISHKPSQRLILDTVKSWLVRQNQASSGSSR